MTDRQMEALRYTLWAELQLPEALEFTLDRNCHNLISQTYHQTSGFMAKFVESYQITLRPNPIITDPDYPFEAGVTVSVHYQHGKWERGGSNGVSTNLFYSREQQRWVDEATARELFAPYVK